MVYVTEVVTTSFQFLERKREMQYDGPSGQNNSNFDNGWGNTRNDIGSSDLPF